MGVTKTSIVNFHRLPFQHAKFASGVNEDNFENSLTDNFYWNYKFHFVFEMEEAAKDISSFLKSIGVKHAFIGGYAAKLHGLEKPMHDLDLYIASDHMDTALKALDEHGSGYK